MSGTARSLLAICLLSMSFGAVCAQNARFPSVRQVKTFVVKDASLTPPDGARAQSDEKWHPRQGLSPEDSWYPADLVCVQPGGLEPKGRGPGFNFAYDELLGLEYEPGSFAFAGRGDSLFWQSKTGWGSEDINQDALPLLTRMDYEDVKEPCYEFIWQRNANVPALGDSIYLNYMFKIPKQNRPAGAMELRVDRQYFDRGFQADAPEVVGGRCVVWDSGSLYAYDATLGTRDSLRQWRSLPSDFKTTCFSLSKDGASLVMSSASQTVSCFAAGSPAPRWTVPGVGPVIAVGGFAYAMTPDFSAIQAIRLSDGKAALVCKLPRSLPRTPDSFASARLSGTDFLLLLIPSQSKVMLLEVR